MSSGHQEEQRQVDDQKTLQNDASNIENAQSIRNANTHADARPGRVARFFGAPLSFGNALILLVIVGAIVVLVSLAIGPTREGSRSGINDADYARGLITLIFSGGTMLIAVLLALYAITADSPHAGDRFTHGKEVLTVLIGVFGTILGFYFGKSDNPPPAQQIISDKRDADSPADSNPEKMQTDSERTVTPTSNP